MLHMRKGLDLAEEVSMSVNERSFGAQATMNHAAPPPQTPPAVEDRTGEILFRIRATFAEKGFDGASMQDLARAAGMSVGNFYRYFPSKAAIIEAMVAFDMAEMERDFALILTSPDPMATLRAEIVKRLHEDCDQDGRLWAEIAAAALRKPEIGAASQRMEELVAQNLIKVFAHSAHLHLAAAAERFGGHARFIVMMVKAAAMRLESARDTHLQALILRSIDCSLADIPLPQPLSPPVSLHVSES
jgi:AcrR family transcriptional regulator